jgi:hypothetical protein
MENLTSLIKNFSQQSEIDDVTDSQIDDVTDSQIDEVANFYFVNPGFPQIVFESCFAVLILIGIFGVIANFSILVLFFISPHVSLYVKDLLFQVPYLLVEWTNTETKNALVSQS